MLRLRISSLVDYIVQISCTLDSFKWLQEVSESPLLIKKTDFFSQCVIFLFTLLFPLHYCLGEFLLICLVQMPVSDMWLPRLTLE